MIVRELELDLDAFEGPFDLLLTLVLRDELAPGDVDIAAIVLAFVERLAARDELDLEACGEFLVLVASLLELKVRALFPDEEVDLTALEPEEAAEELARRLEEYRRIREAAAWLSRAARDGARPLLPARPGAPSGAWKHERRLAPQDPAQLATALRALAVPPPELSLDHMALRFPPVSQFLERFRALLRRRARFDFDRRSSRLSRVEDAVAFLALLELRRAVSSIARRRHSRRYGVAAGRTRPPRKEGCPVERPLRLITANPSRARAHDRGTARRRLAAALTVASSVRQRTRTGPGRDGARAARRAVPRGPERDRPRAGGRRVGLRRIARGGRGVRTALRAAGRAGPVGRGPRDAGDRRLPRPVLAARDRAHPGVAVTRRCRASSSED